MANIVPVTYSGQDLSGTFQHPLIPPVVLSGIAGQGLNQVSIRMTTDHANMKVGMDGAVIISYTPGEQGEIELQVWQTSSLHQQLLAWYNQVISAAQTGDVTNFASGTIYIQNLMDGSSHTATGVCPMKVPDKVYAGEAQTINWVLRAASIINE